MSDNQKSSQEPSQSVTFRYSQEATSEGFNRLLCDILPCGIYKGGEITLPSNDEIATGAATELQIWVEPLVCYIKSNTDNGVAFENVAVRFEINERRLYEVGNDPSNSSNVDPASCYVILRCSWANSDKSNVASVQVVKKEDILLFTDIVLGRVYLKEDANDRYIIDREHYLDTTCRQEVFLKDLEKVSEYFKVTVKDTPDNNVIVAGGVLNTTSGYKNIKGKAIPVPDIENETDARTDLICITDDWKIHLKRGVPYSYAQGDTSLRPYPSYAGVKPIAEIRRAGIRRDVRGGDIVSVFDGTIIGSYANAKDTPVKDIEGLLPDNTSRNVEDVLALLLKSTIALHNNDTLEKADGNTEENTATRGAVYKRNIKFDANDENGVYSGDIPVKDVRSDTNPDGRFANSNVEAVLKELAGDGRTIENLKELSDNLSNLNDKVDQNKNEIDEALDAHINDTVLDNENHTIHGSVSSPTPSTLMQRDEYGKTQVATADENDNEKTVVNKEYVDTAINNVNNTVNQKETDINQTIDDARGALQESLDEHINDVV